MFAKETYVSRRNRLKQQIGKGQILIFGNNEAPMNYKANTYRFRQDSNFLYFFGINQPGLIGFIDIDNDTEIIFGHELTMDDIIWEGPVEPLSSLAEKVGVFKTYELDKIKTFIKEPKYLPTYRGERQIFIEKELGINYPSSIELIKAVVAQRSIKTVEELDKMTDAVNITRAMHIAAMKATKPGKFEYEVVAEILRTMAANHAELAYPIIFSINGQTLHNHHHNNLMTDGRLAINDTGAEIPMGYAGDITRSFPVSGKFTQQQKDIYNIVLKMEVESIEAMKPGISYRDIHVAANRIMIEGFKELGLLQGSTDDMIHEGVAGMFMPHGLGHAIGLDVHDMEDLGEQFVGYSEGQVRSNQLGLKSLRFAKQLEIGNVLTVEPGCYFIPELIQKYRSEGKFKDFVNYDRLDSYLNFGGIRIEDNVVVTEKGYQILGDYIPKKIEEVEELMS